jgi:Cohesin domain/PEP-CTERM motif
MSNPQFSAGARPFVRMLIFAALLCPLTSHATFIGFLPSVTEATTGDSFDVDVVVGDLSSAAEIVSAFDLTIGFDPSVLEATGVTFGTSLGDPFFFEVFEDFLIGPGTTFGGVSYGAGEVNIAALSLLGDSGLAPLQGDSVVLATLSFTALTAGATELSFIPGLVPGVPGLDVSGAEIVPFVPGLLEFDSIGTGSVTVTDPMVSVPEPGTWALLACGMLVIVILRRRALGNH